MPSINYRSEFERYRRYYRALEPILEKQKTRAYTTAVFSFLAVSLFGWYAIKPTIQTILFLRRDIADKTEINKKMEDKISLLIEAQAAYQAAQPQLPLVAEAMPPDPNAIDVVSQIRNLANSIPTASLSSVQVPSAPLQGKDASGSAGKTDEPELPVTIVLYAPFSGIRTFVDGILSMRRLLSFEGISLSPARDTTNIRIRESSPSGTMLRLVLRLKTYYQPPVTYGKGP